jgi:hypothetical protein
MRKLLFLLFAGLLVWGIGCQKDELFKASDNQQLTQRNGYTEEDIQNSIDAGIAWLLTQQDGTGRFGGSSYNEVARTALAVTKLCDKSFEDGDDPTTGDYADEISAGLAFILNNASTYGGGIRLNSYSPGHDVYSTGIAMMALDAYGCPGCVITSGNPVVNGLTYQQVLQGCVDFFEYIQNPDGGWRYSDNSMPSDNSNSGFAALGLLAAGNSGSPADATVLSNFSTWLDYIQNDVSGGSGYTDPNSWVNVLKTGNLLFEFGLVGDAPTSGRVIFALQYLENFWNADGSCTGDFCPGWKPNNYLAMYCIMKGCVSMGFDMIGPYDWYNEFMTAILNNQEPGGYWLGEGWNDIYEATVLNLLTLEKFTPTVIVPVFFDIHPTSCPNPINRKSKGVTPMAILGTAEFDVSNINTATINIQGISPVNISMSDVATPYLPGPEEDDPYSCNTEGPDGFGDLLLKFNTQDLAGILAGYSEGDVVLLSIEGELFDGRLFRGEDVIKIVK